MTRAEFEKYVRTLSLEDLSQLALKLYELWKIDNVPVLNLYVTVKHQLKERRGECDDKDRCRRELDEIYPQRFRKGA